MLWIAKIMNVEINYLFLFYPFLSHSFPTISTAESDPCEHLDCAEHEWCGEKDGVYGCFCDEHHHRANNESYGENSSSLNPAFILS